MGGLRFLGWIDDLDEHVLEAVVDGETVSQVRATHWTRVEDESDMLAGRNVRGFDFHLPQRFADGCVHKLTLRHPDGDLLTRGGNIRCLPRWARQTLLRLGDYNSEQLRGRLYDKLVPASLPLDDFAQWQAGFPLPAPSASSLETAVIVVGTSGAEQTLATLESQSHLGWTAGVIDGPALEIAPDLLVDFLQQTAPKAEIVVIMMAGMRLNETALARIASTFEAEPETHALYCDLDFLADDGQLWPICFPAFDYEECWNRVMVPTYSRSAETSRSRPCNQLQTICIAYSMRS
jgi:hypothetical protein